MIINMNPKIGTGAFVYFTNHINRSVKKFDSSFFIDDVYIKKIIIGKTVINNLKRPHNQDSIVRLDAFIRTKINLTS